ncbi:MAG: hypothetical protein RUDDFDWM_001765 [Candidatus Fervidibacterota bacterium]
MRPVTLAILLVSLLLCFYNLGSMPLFDQDEPRYASAARTMIETKNYVVPYFNGQPRYQKPVLIYWLMCASFKLFGINEFAARFPSALSVVLLVLITFIFAKRYLSPFGAVVAALSLATSFGVVASAHVATTDALLHLLIGSAFMSFFHAECLTASEHACAPTKMGRVSSSLFFYLLAYALSGFAILTKGPIGFILPALGICSYWMLTRQFVSGLKRSHILAGFVMLTLINLPWWTLASLQTGGEFLRVFFLRENIQRFASVKHAQPIWYFIPVLFVFFFPWSAFIPQAWLYGVRTMMRKLMSSLAYRTMFETHQSLVSYCTCWSLAIIIFFSLSKCKNPQYILPSFSSLALLCGWWFDRFLKGEFDVAQLRRTAIGLSFLSALLTSLVLLTPKVINVYFRHRFTYGDELVDLGWGIHATAIALALCGVVGIFVMRTRVGKSYQALFPFVLACLMIAVNLSLAHSVAPRIAYYRQEPLRDFAIAIGATAHPHDAIVVFKRDQSSVVYYSHRVVMRINDVAELRKVIQAHKRTFIIAKRKDMNELLSEFGDKVHVIQERLAYALLVIK